jgi:hypothetical protein
VCNATSCNSRNSTGAVHQTNDTRYAVPGGQADNDPVIGNLELKAVKRNFETEMLARAAAKCTLRIHVNRLTRLQRV